MKSHAVSLVVLLGLALAGPADAQFSSQKSASPAGKGSLAQPKGGGAALGGAQGVGSAPAASGRGGSMGLLVGGGDSCAAPDLISGPGSVLFDLTAATTGSEGQAEGLCYFFGSSTIDADVWFAWTATSTGTAALTTCGTTTVDTKIAVYGGGSCPTNGAAISCNDDVCGFQSSLSFAVVSGSTYMLQVGTFPGATPGTGSFDIAVGAVPANDDCATPIALLGPGPYPFDNIAATTGVEGQLEGLCYFFGSSTVDNDVWFTWTAPATGLANVSTCGGTAVDTKVSVYAGTGCPTSGTSLACSDDVCGLQSLAQFNAIAGSTYTIQLGTFPGNVGGTGSFTVEVPPATTNGDCASAAPISGQGSLAFDTSTTLTSGFDGGGSCAAGASAVNQDLFWQWTSTVAGDIEFNTFGSSFDTMISVHAGTGCAATCVAHNDDFGGLQSKVDVFGVNIGDVLLIQVGGWGTSFGPGTLNFGLIATPPVGPDSCTTPTVIAGSGTFAFDLTQATTGTQGQNEALCYFFQQTTVHNDVWFAWTAPSTGTAEVSVCGLSTVDTKLAAYPGAGCPIDGTALACNDDACNLQSSISFAVNAGQTYMIQLGTWGPALFGTGSLSVDVPGGNPFTGFCSGDGTAAGCPCGNVGGAGRGCDNFTGSGGALLAATGSNSVSAGDMVLNGSGAQANQPGLYFQGNNAILGGQGIVNGDGLRCAGGSIRRLQIRQANVSGESFTTVNIGVQGLVSPGDTRRYQWWYRNPGTSACGTGFNLSNGVETTWIP